MNDYRYDTTAIAANLIKIEHIRSTLSSGRLKEMGILKRLALKSICMATHAFMLAFSREIAPEK